ncbi:hypothetical protein [Flavobacterium beibuense]|uniref:Tetratricopeptide repeat protein n=1 Tax=Flavobacterium beibuense TaxID=657326 RepID=A0A444WIE8_9FLAO|nr:hypothetical protein [Flavobacterium beibuense]RYJ45504.1 hypothetical protein NU09_0096 [Flavobacterium beibuense]
MKTNSCIVCGDSKPVNETIAINSQLYCTGCFESTFTSENMLENKTIEVQRDPTVCSFCKKDFDTVELNKISQYPICPDCEVDVKNKTFPLWVKGFFAAVLVLVIFSFFWNWKYFTAYNSVNEAGKLYGEGDFASAAKEMTKARDIVPEVQDLTILISYYNGIALLQESKYTEALKEFAVCKEYLPENYDIDFLIVSSKIGLAFDNKDYEAFLDLSKERLELYPDIADYRASVASAYACIYAEKGDDDAKAGAFEYLDKAKAVDSISDDAKQYYKAIEYRIYSRNIITREEFQKQFPNGWTKS